MRKTNLKRQLSVGQQGSASSQHIDVTAFERRLTGRQPEQRAVVSYQLTAATSMDKAMGAMTSMGLIAFSLANILLPEIQAVAKPPAAANGMSQHPVFPNNLCKTALCRTLCTPCCPGVSQALDVESLHQQACCSLPFPALFEDM